MGLNGLEPSTSRLSGVRSNQLSYKPISFLLTLDKHFNLFIKQLFRFQPVVLTPFCFLFKVKFGAGSHLLSHTVSSAVPSAAYVLTVVFGMGTGVSHKRITTGKLSRFK